MCIKHIVLLSLISLFCFVNCHLDPAPYEDVLNNDDLTSFIKRNFDDFVSVSFDINTANTILQLSSTWATFNQARTDMDGFCSPEGFKVWYFDRFLYKDRGWKDKWRSIYENLIANTDSNSEEYLTGLILIISN